mmetsp:Transcript_18438/g.28462  ORF Transcript_18438/g.28462 Transcript_18438/m.28462 type:complete len:350 (-) Transcript_18438:13-1062(-)
MRVQGRSIPSMYTQAMVGDGHYDLIILEFYLRANEGLNLLTKRLRQRFPNAVIVLLRKWNPMYIKHVKTGAHLNAWMSQHGFLGRLHDAEFHHYLMTQTNREDWTYHFDDSTDLLQAAIAKEYGAHIYELPKHDDPRLSIKEMNRWFADDMQHVTAEGHEVIAFGIHQMLVEKQIVVEKSDEVGTWGDGDLCDTWYWSGEVSKSLSVSRNMRMNQFNTKSNKWALELSNEGGAITVTNPFPEKRSLVLMFMATGTPGVYPKTLVTLNSERDSDHRQQQLGSVELDPSVTVYRHDVHVGLTANLGFIPPGKTILRLKPLEETENPFRLTGYAISHIESHANSVQVAAPGR